MWRPFLLASALACAGLPLYIHLPRHAASDLGLSLSLVAAALLALRLFDFCQDPFLGRLADKFPDSKFFLAAAGAGGMLAGYIALFALPPAPMPLAWLAISLALLVSGFSLLNILFYGQSLAIAGSIASLPRLAAWREAGGTVGILFAALLPELLATWVSRPNAYALFGYFVALLIASAFWFSRPCWASATQRNPSVRRANVPSLRELQNAGCNQLLVLVFLNSLPVALTSTLFLFFVDDRLALPGKGGAFLAAFFCAASISAPAWGRLLARFGPRNTLAAAMLLAVFAFCGAAMLPQGAAIPFFIICLASGIAIGGDLVVLPEWFSARLADASLEAGAAYGLWSSTGKLALAVGSGLALPLLDAAGFKSGTSNEPAALWWLVFLYAILPCFLKLSALVLLLRFPPKEAIQ